ncbi:hypothetical protein ES705_19108 [subsurface metagenome]
MVYYFKKQKPEEVVADILVESGFLSEYERAGWLANANYVTPTGKNIDRVWFNKGTTCFEALRLVAEVVQYRFYPDQDGNPIFKPPPIASLPVKLVTIDSITVSNLRELVDEVKNHIIIKGEERKRWDKLPTVATRDLVIDAKAKTAAMCGVIDSVGKGNVTERGFQWGIAMLANKEWHENGDFEVGLFLRELTEKELDFFIREDGCISPGDINVPHDEIRVSMDIATGSKISFSTTEGGVLPDPLIAGTSYYAIRVDSRHIQVATSKDDALAGIQIDITDRGSGVQTLTLSVGHWYRAYVENFQGMFFGKWQYVEVTF